MGLKFELANAVWRWGGSMCASMGSHLMAAPFSCRVGLELAPGVCIVSRVGSVEEYKSLEDVITTHVPHERLANLLQVAEATVSTAIDRWAENFEKRTYEAATTRVKRMADART